MRVLLLLVLLVCAACTRQEDAQLQRAEEYYIQHHVINDSIDGVLAQIVTKPGSQQDFRKRALQAAHLYQKGNVEKAFDAFDALSREMKTKGVGEAEAEVAPYWRAVVEDYMGFIYLGSGLAGQSRPHFYKVLDYAHMMHDDRAIANACSHISVYHHTMGQLDSALYYASKPLSYESVLDSQMVAIVYNNLAVMQSSIAQSEGGNVLGTLQLSRKYNMHSRDSLITCALMSQAYYLQGRPDSALLCQQEVECGGHDVAKLILYRFLADYYDQQERTDSAYKYMKLYRHMESICLNDNLVEPILDIADRHDRQEAEQRFEGERLSIVIISLLVILLVALGLWLLHRRQLDRVYRQIESLSSETGRTAEGHEDMRALHQKEDEGAPAVHADEEPSALARSQKVSAAQEEEAYLSSGICQRLKQKAEANEPATPEEWAVLEQAVKDISPDFYDKFHALRKVSDLEYRVCLLTRARIAPADMAVLLCKARSSITTVRSRLYEKVFDRKGGSREWDEFILSL